MFLYVFIIIVLAGCSSERIEFSGKSESWEGTYHATIGDSEEDGEYVFNYKSPYEDMEIKDLSIDINDGETVLQEDKGQGTTIKIPTYCSGCAKTDVNKPIEVTIEWGEDKEETFLMESK